MTFLVEFIKCKHWRAARPAGRGEGRGPRRVSFPLKQSLRDRDPGLVIPQGGFGINGEVGVVVNGGRGAVGRSLFSARPHGELWAADGITEPFSLIPLSVGHWLWATAGVRRGEGVTSHASLDTAAPVGPSLKKGEAVAH